MGKLFLVLLGLAVVAAVIDAAPPRRNALKSMAKRDVFAAKKAVKHKQPMDRKGLIERLKQLTPEDIQEMSEQDRLGLLYMIDFFDIDLDNLEKRENVNDFDYSQMAKQQEDFHETYPEFDGRRK